MLLLAMLAADYMNWASHIVRDYMDSYNCDYMDQVETTSLEYFQQLINNRC
jgi:hypothetical protein